MQSSALNALLIQAVQDNEMKKTEDYLTLGASPNQMIDSKTHLMEVALDKNPSIFQLLIKSSKNKPNNEICHHLTAKVIAIQKPDLLKVLLPFTPLTKKEILPFIFDAIKNENISCLNIFLDFHIDCLNMKQNNLSPLDYAAQLEKKSCMENIISIALGRTHKMISSPSLNALLVQTVKENDAKKIKDYLTLGASSNQMIDSKTHLIEYVLENDKSENSKVLELLASKSSDRPNNAICHRLLSKAIIMQKPNTLNILLPFLQLTKRETLSYIFDMIKKGNTFCLKWFLDFQKDYLNMKKNNLSPMKYATQLGRKACIQIMVNASLEHQYENEFKKIKTEALSQLNVFLYWHGLIASTDCFADDKKKFKQCSNVDEIIKICDELDRHTYEFWYSDRKKITTFIKLTQEKFCNLQNKIKELNQQKAQCPMIEEMKKDFKDQDRFFSISRIQSASRMESIHDSSLELETPKIKK